MKCDICGGNKYPIKNQKEIGTDICEKCIDYDLYARNIPKIRGFLGNKISPLSIENSLRRNRRPSGHEKECNCLKCIEAIKTQARVKAFKEVLQFIDDNCF